MITSAFAWKKNWWNYIIDIGADLRLTLKYDLSQHLVVKLTLTNKAQGGTEYSVEYKTGHIAPIIGIALSSIAVALSSLLPVLSILALYFVQKMILRIILVLIFTTLFSVFLKVFTNARTAEIYSATAACVYSFCSYT